MSTKPAGDIDPTRNTQQQTPVPAKEASSPMVAGRRYSTSGKDEKPDEVTEVAIRVFTGSKEETPAVGERPDLKGQKQDLNAKLRSVKNAMNATKNVSNGLKTRFEELQTKFDSMEFELDSLLDEIQIPEAKKELAEKIQNNIADINEKLEVLATALSEFCKLQQRYEVAANKLNAIKSDRPAENSELVRTKDLKSKIDQLQTDIIKIKDIPPELASKMEKMQEEFIGIVSDLDKAQTKTTGLSEKNKLIQKINERLSNANDDLKGIRSDIYIAKGKSVQLKPEKVIHDVQRTEWTDKEKEWKQKPKDFEKSSDHYRNFIEDIDRFMVLTLNNQEYVKDEGTDKEATKGLCDVIGREFVESLRSAKPGFTDKELQSLRYQLESFTNQMLGGLDPTAFMEWTAAYMEKGLNWEKDETRRSLLDVTFDNNIVTISFKSFKKVINSDDPPQIVGFDGTKTTVTIDLNKIKKELLATPGAVTATMECHGFRKKREEVDL